MDKVFNIEQLRMILVSIMSPILGYFTPTKGFIYALIMAFALNIWAGMRADGVIIIRCKNFSFSKFKNSVCELFLYLFLIEVIFAIMKNCGEETASILAVKSLTFVFVYVYVQNAFKNLIIAYPHRIALRVIYHIIRLEFGRAMPSHIKPIIERVEREQKMREEEKNEKRRD